MDRESKEQVKSWLENGEIDVFLGYRMVDGHPLPYCFHRDKPDEILDLVEAQVRYPLEKTAMTIAAADSGIRIGLLARDCNQRTLNALFVWNQLDPDRVRILDIKCCPSPLKAQEHCSYLKPESAGIFKKEVGIDNRMDMVDAARWGSKERFSRWMYEFEKCIKCYGCRNVCPVCFCKECSLEHSDFVGTGDLPPEVPLFHLARAVHMAGRCIDCGLCEEACPMDIPLRLLYGKTNEIVKRIFGYEAGTAREQSPFSVLEEKITLEPKKIETA